MDVATAIRETSAWPIEDQLELVEEMWDRIVQSGWQPEVDADLQVLLDERARELDENPSRAVSWDQLVQLVRIGASTSVGLVVLSPRPGFAGRGLG